jgi:predicted nucleotidyltransferase
MNNSIQTIKNIAEPILRKSGAVKASLFGSAARNELKKNSDVDILVQFGDDRVSLFDFVGIQLALKDALGRDVDLVEYDCIKPAFRDSILKDELILFNQNENERG